MQIHWTATAKQNLLQLERFIAQDNPTASIAIRLNLIKKIMLLSEQPKVGRIGKTPGTREFLIAKTPYITTYRIKNNCIQVLTIKHGAMKT